MKIKKLLALLLVMGMVVSITPVGTFADDVSGGGGIETGTPVEGGSGTPVEGGSGTPVEGGSGTPVEGGSGTPVEGGSGTPVEGGSGTPVEGGSGTSVEGGSGTPVEGGSGTPVEGGSGTPVEGGSGTPVEGGSGTPVEGEEVVPPVEVLPDPNALYDGMTLEQLYEYVVALAAEDEGRAMAYVEQMQAEVPEVYDQLLAFALSMQEKEETPETEDFTDVGPFLDPVDLSATQGKRSMLKLAGGARSLSVQSSNGLQLSKTAQPNGNGSYQVNLEAWATGQVITTQVPKPVDIILVLDQSGSMAETFSNGKTRQQAMKDSVNSFIDSVAAKAVGMQAGTQHRMALVTFNGNEAANNLSLGFKSDYSALKGLITALPDTPQGATNTGAGMQLAYTILNGDTPPAGPRHKVVILFTDGVPTKNDIFNAGVADTAVGAAKSIKDKGAVVYTVGIFSGANANNTGPSDGNQFSETAAANRFMNYASSNFRNATSTGLKVYEEWFLIWRIYYEITQDAGFSPPARTANNYYLTASTTSALDGIFQNIAQNVDVPGISLGADTLVKDFMSQYFDADTTSVQVSTRAYQGSGTWGALTPANLTVTKDGSSVSVTGFDFSQNFVSETVKTDGTRGKKLIITLNVIPKQGFFGGNQVPTNENTSGIYTPGDPNPVGRFQEPVVDVPIRYQTASQSQAVYLGNAADLSQLLRYQPNYAPDGWNNDYVNIVYQLKQGTTTVGTYTVQAGASSGSWAWETGQTAAPVLANDTVYTLSCTAIPVNNSITGAPPSPTLLPQQQATVYVYKPQMTLAVSDIWADYQKQVNLGEWALGGGTTKAVNYKPTLDTTWVVSSAGQGAPIIGTKPMLDQFSNFTYAFALKAGTIGDTTLNSGIATTGKKDTDFTVALTSFQINGNAFGAGQATVSTQYPNNQGYFTLHTNHFNLMVTKTENAPAAYGGQSFLFDLTGESNSLKLSFSLAKGMDAKLPMSKTFAGLLCGQTYTVSERGDWSWRYKVPAETILAASTTSHAEPSKSNPGASHHNQTMSINNKFEKNNKWLTGSDGKANIFNAQTV